MTGHDEFQGAVDEIHSLVAESGMSDKRADQIDVLLTRLERQYRFLHHCFTVATEPQNP